jgi:MoxR-like ATPase
MPEKIRFLSPEEKREQEIAEALKEEVGILYREEIDPETKEVKKFVNILGVKVETYASKEDIEAIKEEIVLSETDQKMLRAIAECYKLRQPLLFEGDPGVGKTFLMKKFVQLIHGKEAPILEIVGTPRTSELEILGHWTPASEARESKDPVVQDTIRRYDQLEAEYRRVNDEFDARYKKINDEIKDGKITQEEANKQLEGLLRWYKPLQERYASELQSLIQRTTLTGKVEWEFKEGALLQAYSGREGQGYILIVDEFNLIPSNYQQIFLQIGGEKGALSDSISFWGNTGKTRYARGKDTWICFASNYPEKTPGRSEVVAPMTDRLVWKTITPEESEKKKEILRRTAGGRLTNRLKELTPLIPEIVAVPVERGLAWDKVLDEQLGEQIADIVDLFDREFVKIYQEVGDKITKEGGRRTQQFEFSGRNPLRVFDYLDHFQVRNPETGRIDFSQTLKNAFELYYINRLVSEEAQKRMRELLQELLEPKNMKAIKKSEEILKARGKGLPPGAVIFEGEIVSRKELFDILVERASITEEEKKRLEQEKIKEERRKLAQAKDDAKNAIMSALQNPNISEEIKNPLREILERIKLE